MDGFEEIMKSRIMNRQQKKSMWKDIGNEIGTFRMNHWTLERWYGRVWWASVGKVSDNGRNVVGKKMQSQIQVLNTFNGEEDGGEVNTDVLKIDFLAEPV